MGSGEEGNLFSESIEYIADIVAANVPVYQEERQEGWGKERDRDRERGIKREDFREMRV